MTVRAGTSVVAGSGSDAQEVNSLIESVNALTAKWKSSLRSQIRKCILQARFHKD